jgi:hypothetical protein
MNEAGRIAQGGTNQGTWDLPFELAIACSSSVFTGVVRDRARRGIFPVGPAKVTAHGRQLVASVPYAHGDVFFALDVELQALRP